MDPSQYEIPLWKTKCLQDGSLVDHYFLTHSKEAAMIYGNKVARGSGLSNDDYVVRVGLMQIQDPALLLELLKWNKHGGGDPVVVLGGIEILAISGFE